jgi:Rod binding domain-containing protein
MDPTAAIFNARPADARRDQLTRQAQRLVSQNFFGTLLKQMRSSPLRSELLDGGRGGQAFGALLDQHLAERMARGAAAPLVHSIVRSIERKMAGFTGAQRATDHVTPTART